MNTFSFREPEFYYQEQDQRRWISKALNIYSKMIFIASLVLLLIVINTSMERFSRVLQHGNQIFFFFKVWNWIWLVFWLVLKSWNQHSSRSQTRNMHLYVDIGDALSSFWGSTSSFSIIYLECACFYLFLLPWTVYINTVHVYHSCLHFKKSVKRLEIMLLK